MSRNKKTSESLFQFMNLLIALLLKNGQYRTSLHYKATLNCFNPHCSHPSCNSLISNIQIF